MHVLATLLPLAALAAANGRLNFNAFDHANCQGFEENYSLNPATVKGNFPGTSPSVTTLPQHPIYMSRSCESHARSEYMI
jgi:hypothetical protein